MKRPISYLLTITLLLTLTACTCGVDEGRTTAILAVNDIYRISAVDNGERGGIARVRTLRAELEQTYPELMLLHAGDILYPSMLSREFKGRQMVSLLNLLDGSETAFDDRMWATFGNHEFDKSKMADYYGLKETLSGSGFTWLASNIDFSEKMGGLKSDKVIKSQIVESGGIKLGLFSVTINNKIPAYAEIDGDYIAVAKQYTAELRKAGAEVVIALTHLSVDEDMAILEALKTDGPDIIIGGHEHNYQVHQSSEGRYIVKADADARSANLVKIEMDAEGKPTFSVVRRDLDQTIMPDATVKQAAQQWHQRFDHEICGRTSAPLPFIDSPLPDGCLSDAFSHTKVELVAEELEIRRFETNLGNWIADQARDSYVESGAQVAIVNSGSLRLNQDLPAGSEITRSHLLEIFAYPSPMGLVEIDGKTLQLIINRAIEEWSGNGHWLQISGFAFRHDVENGKAEDLTLLTPEGPRAVSPDEKIKLVLSDFLYNPQTGQDGYTMLKAPQMKTLAEPDAKRDLRELVREALMKAGENGIAPELDGRICNSQRGGNCLAVSVNNNS